MANTIYTDMPTLEIDIASNSSIGSAALSMSSMSSTFSGGAALPISLPDLTMEAEGTPGAVAGMLAEAEALSMFSFAGSRVSASVKGMGMTGTASVILTGVIEAALRKMSLSGSAYASDIISSINSNLSHICLSASGEVGPVGSLLTRTKALEFLMSGLHGGVGGLGCDLPRLDADMLASVNQYDGVSLEVEFGEISAAFISDSDCSGLELQYIRGAVR